MYFFNGDIEEPTKSTVKSILEVISTGDSL